MEAVVPCSDRKEKIRSNKSDVLFLRKIRVLNELEWE